MDLYINSLIFIIIGSLFVIPLIILKGFSKYATLLFYIVLLAATILRPNLLGIDNYNLIEAITNKEAWTDESFKYTVIYYLTYLIPGTWQKIVGLNLISSLISIFSLKRIFKSIRNENKNKYIILIYMSYFLGISTSLILIHARQYLAFSILFILLNLYRSNNRNYILIEFLLSILIFTIHPLYFTFLIFYFISKYFRNKFVNFLKYSTFLTKLLVFLILFLPFIFIYNNVDYLYSFFSNNLGGYAAYSIEKGIIETSLISKIYLLVLILPIIFIYRICKKYNESNNIKTEIIIYLLFSLPLIFLESKLGFLYAIGRVKTGLYPAIFILLYHLENFKISKNVVIWSTLFLTLFNTYSIIRTSQGL